MTIEITVIYPAHFLIHDIREFARLYLSLYDYMNFFFLKKKKQKIATMILSTMT
jgi:hypothetical protein